MKKTMKRMTLSIVTVATIATQSHAIFGVGDIVFDPAAVAKATSQILLLKKQLEQAKKTCVAACGVKDAVKMYNDVKALTGAMKKFKVSIDDLDIDNPKSKIGQMAQKIFEENKIFDICGVEGNSELKKQVCKNKQTRNVSEIATAIMYSDDLEETGKRLKDLSKKLANSKDSKTSQDIGNALQLELAQLELSRSRVDMMTKANAAKSKTDADKLKQENAKKCSKPCNKW